MKKYGLVVVLLILIVGVVLLSSKSSDSNNQISKTDAALNLSKSKVETQEGNLENSVEEKTLADDYNEEDDFFYEDIKPATDVYANATEAYDAVLKAAADYDDIVLEQFANLRNCSWCPEFFDSIKEKVVSKDLSENDRSYLAELLAVTGNVDNIKTLIEAYKNDTTDGEREVFIEALELSSGSEELLNYLKEELNTQDEALKESILAAVTNNGSTKAIEALYNETLKSGDKDGFYSLGIGIAEIIPEKEAIPYLVEIANKRDDYSHLAIKSLLNDGADGLREVVEIISRSNNSEENKRLLQDAIDHVGFDEDTERYVDNILATSSHPDVIAFAKEIKEDLASEDDDYDDDEDDFEEE